jgi:hypothetical protein
MLYVNLDANNALHLHLAREMKEKGGLAIDINNAIVLYADYADNLSSRPRRSLH